MSELTLDEIARRATRAAETLTRAGIPGVQVTDTRRGVNEEGGLGREVSIQCPLPVIMLALESLARDTESIVTPTFPHEGSIDA